MKKSRREVIKTARKIIITDDLITPTLTKNTAKITEIRTNATVAAIFYGLDKLLLKNITDKIIQKCIASHGKWVLPANDVDRAVIFGDPIPNVVKNVLIKLSNNVVDRSFTEVTVLSDICEFSYDKGDLTVELTRNSIDIDKLYHEACTTPSDISEHLPTLYQYAKKCRHVTEMGVRFGSSTRAFLYAAPERLVSYDLNIDPIVDSWFEYLKSTGRNYSYIKANTLGIKIEKTDFLFIDTLHNYEQLKTELNLHASSVMRYIAFHDTSSFGEIGESYTGESNKRN